VYGLGKIMGIQEDITSLSNFADDRKIYITVEDWMQT
jgi:hypothetical protein